MRMIDDDDGLTYNYDFFFYGSVLDYYYHYHSYSCFSHSSSSSPSSFLVTMNITMYIVFITVMNTVLVVSVSWV